MEKRRNRRSGIPILTRRGLEELKAMPESDLRQLREDAEACKKRILEARKQKGEGKKNENF